MAAGVVTVAIPVLNGARYLDEVLTAVRAQNLPGGTELDLLVIDSGSSDGSLSIAERHAARIHSIPKSEFSHGGTRNLAMKLAEGDHVAFITQDATPAHERWLAALLEGFRRADDVALVFGPHDPRPDASHMIKCEMERHFALWPDGNVQRLDRSSQGLSDYRAYPGKISFFSDVNGCVARWAWEQIPYREVPYAEDQLLGREMVEAGFAKVYMADAAVLHSHDYPPAQFLRRYFDEFRGMREVLGHREAWGVKRTPWAVRGLSGADKRWLRAHGVHGKDLVKPLTRSVIHHTTRMTGAIVGSRADKLPAAVRGKLSLEGRDTFTPYDVPASPLLEQPTVNGQRSTVNAILHRKPDQRTRFTDAWWFDFVRHAYPRRPLRIDNDGSPRSEGPWTIAWVVPTWKVGSGGHTTIFRLVRQMELRGHRCAIFVFDHKGVLRKSASELREEIREHFIPIEAQVFIGLDDFDSADVAIATEWSTAFPVRDLPRCREKVYLVQDDEPRFFAASAESIWAEETYRMGYRCIAYTPWMAEILERDYGLEARWFECGTDLDTYTFAGEDGREPGHIAVYGRRETPRRAVELAVAGIANLFERRPGLRVTLFGSNIKGSAPFPCADLGVQPPGELAALYRRASAGVVFSLTTHSLVAQEMMASGLPVVELEGDNVSSALGASGERVMLAAHTPDSIADALERVLDDPEAAAAMARRARAFVEERTWERAGDQVEGALREYLANPRVDR
ncbi:MAG TPA: glycosyltransferase [Thermoleophilaceae bacterium]|jgi:glycosyltransferase involved in cell wall biosynthesis